MTLQWVFLRQKSLGAAKRVRTALCDILKPDLTAPNAITTHQALLTLGKARDGHTRLITTNFDRLFEVAIGKATLPERFRAPLLPVPKLRWDGLVYLHGLLPEHPLRSDLERLVLSSGDFGLAYLTERWAARFVSELLRNYTVCFVGYSINDPVLRYMMDAHAADGVLGESQREMFAFGSHSKGKESEAESEWEIQGRYANPLPRTPAPRAPAQDASRVGGHLSRRSARKRTDRRRLCDVATDGEHEGRRLRRPSAMGTE